MAYVRLAAGRLETHASIRLMASEAEAEALELGFFRPQAVPVPSLSAGEVGYVATGLKSVRDCQVGDTLTSAERPAARRCPATRRPCRSSSPVSTPSRGPDYPALRDALEKLHLNDASLVYEPETSVALGFGFRCGFLGLLHMEIAQERLEREFGLQLIASAPSVAYRVTLTNGRGEREVDNPADLPEASEIEVISEPWVRVSVITPSTYIGALMELATNRRGSFETMEYLDPTRVQLAFQLPLAEVIVDFFDQLKSRSQGYASMDYEEIGYRPARLARLDILVNGEPVDALSLIVHRDRARAGGSPPRGHPPRAHPAPDVRGAHPGRDGLHGHRPRDGAGHAQERPGQVLRW